MWYHHSGDMRVSRDVLGAWSSKDAVFESIPAVKAVSGVIENATGDGDNLKKLRYEP